jgi:hypothetical protein
LPCRFCEDAGLLEKLCRRHCLALSGVCSSRASLAACRLTAACSGLMPNSASSVRVFPSRFMASCLASKASVPGCRPWVPFFSL